MGNYFARRIAVMIPTLVLVTVFVFFIMRLMPGDPATVQLGDETTLEAVAALKEQLGLDKPALVQYFRWAGSILQGDFGDSFISHRPLLQEIQNRAPVSIELGVLAIMASLSLALPLGIVSAIRPESPTDYVSRLITVAGVAVPSYALATILFVMPSVWFHWSPPVPYLPIWDDPLANLQQLALPVLSVAAALGAVTARMTRSTLLNVMREDYMRTAYSKGLSERDVVLRHALRNGLLPIITVVGNQIPVLISGTVITETIFDLPGMGTMMFAALGQRDYPVIQGVLLVAALVVLSVNLLIDFMYAALDPRIRLT